MIFRFRLWISCHVISGDTWCPPVVNINFDHSVKMFFNSPLCSYYISHATNKWSIWRNYKTLQIFYFSSKYCPGLNIHWWFLLELIIAMMIAKWWFSSSSTSYPFTNCHSTSCCKEDKLGLKSTFFLSDLNHVINNKTFLFKLFVKTFFVLILLVWKSQSSQSVLRS